MVFQSRLTRYARTVACWLGARLLIATALLLPPAHGQESDLGGAGERFTELERETDKIYAALSLISSASSPDPYGPPANAPSRGALEELSWSRAETV